MTTLDRRGFFATVGAAIVGVFAGWRSTPVGEYDIKFDGDPPHGIALQMRGDNADWIQIDPIDADGGFLVYQKYAEDIAKAMFDEAFRIARVPPKPTGE